MDEEVPPALAGERLDRVVAFATGLSRSEVDRLLAAGSVRLDGRTATARSSRVSAGQRLEVDVPEPTVPGVDPDPSVSFAVVHEDDHVIVVDKPADLVVHPGAGHRSGTLVNGLVARYPGIAVVGDPDRPGLVHRLDRGTSGLLVAALTPEAHAVLAADMAARRVRRRYTALVEGEVADDAGVVDAPVGRSTRHPTRMTVSTAGRSARTRYRVTGRYRDPRPLTLLECELETGRTHQIRVHLAAIGHPVTGDTRYGGRGDLLDRPFLHASSLAFTHPVTAQAVELVSALPEDLRRVLGSLS
ncbi:MAG TPA: RluA family pseudouridine synthase [Acidimicrobiales bacterium]|nr:RluA family pseudouridine synthase [Acidimicrobiales bacterium]